MLQVMPLCLRTVNALAKEKILTDETSCIIVLNQLQHKILHFTVQQEFTLLLIIGST